MRLGYLVPEFPAQTHIFFWREICALRAMGEQVFLLSTRKPSPIACRHAFADTAVAETHYVFPPKALAGGLLMAGGPSRLKIAVKYIGQLTRPSTSGGIQRYGLLASALDLLRWSARHRIEHIHGHSCGDAAHVLALCRLLGGPSYSLTLHGDLPVYGTDHASKMSSAAFVAVVGGHLQRQVIEQVGIPEQRLFVTCMGVDTSGIAAGSQNRSYESGALHLVTVARLNPAKGHAHALAAIRRGVDAGLDLRYTIAGDGPHEQHVRAKIRELGLETRVTMTGTQSEDEVVRLLSTADVFLLPSVGLGEAWPVSVMEAMSAGLPVIASVIGATPEMITSGRDGILVPQKDEGAILQSLQQLASDVDYRRGLGTEARRTAQARFDVHNTARALRDRVATSMGPPHEHTKHPRTSPIRQP